MSKKSGKEIRLGLYAAGNVKCPICLTPFRGCQGIQGRQNRNVGARATQGRWGLGDVPELHFMQRWCWWRS